ncbi:MAG: hypothetical protein GKR93_02580 [Gammaproteobacteria bacterium]|nr:hypothetical protein [Gammaproteobacteria bacterium]
MSDFDDLRPYIEHWGQAEANQRLRLRVEAELAELEEFYNALSPKLEAIIQYLNQYPVNKIPEADKPLANMLLALCEVDDAIHIWKSTNLDYISDPITWRTKLAYSDYR